MSRIVIAIDAGHGGKNHGTRSSDGDLREPYLTLAVASLAAELLDASDVVDPVLTRVEDLDLHHDERAGIAARAGASAVVSVHFNSARDGRRRGGELYHHHGDRVGLELGLAILGRLGPGLPVWASDERWEGKVACPGALAVTSAYAEAGLPCALVECAFLSSPVDCARLRVAGALDVYARAIAEGCEAWARAKHQPQGDPQC